MGVLNKLFGKKTANKSEEAVLIHLDGVGLPDEIYQSCDLATLEDQLIEVIHQLGAGEFDGNEVGETMTTLYTYGPDAEKLFAAMEPVLRSYPLCRNANVVIRKGGPGSPQTELQL